MAKEERQDKPKDTDSGARQESKGQAAPAAEKESPTGGDTATERKVDRFLGNVIHLFLSALLLIIAAIITTFDTVVRDFPKLWWPTSEYASLQNIIQNILLIAIAAELDLLLPSTVPAAQSRT